VLAGTQRPLKLVVAFGHDIVPSWMSGRDGSLSYADKFASEYQNVIMHKMIEWE
jgi:hypothetical protein